MPMKPIAPKPDLFTLNRQRLKALLMESSLAVVNANDVMPTNAAAGPVVLELK